MSTDDNVMEQQLRELFAEVPAPAAPVSWGRAPVAGSGRRIVWRFTLAVAVAVVVGAALVAVQLLRATYGPAVLVSAYPAAADVTCSLPIAALSADQTTGFVVFHNGRATFRPVQTSGTSYDPTLGRWVPVLPQLVAPDGRSYVEQDFANGQTIVRLVDASGTRTVLKTSLPVGVFAHTSHGILLIEAATGRTPFDGSLTLLVLDPATAAVRPWPFAAPQPGVVRQAGGGSEAGYRREDDAIWMTAYYPSADRTVVQRYDLATGVTTQWFDGQTDGTGHLEVVATDGHGHPIVQLSDHDLFHTDPAHRSGIEQRTILLTAPHLETVLNQGRVGEPGVAGNLGPLSVNDGDRVWLAADDGTIWMYLPGSGLQRMAKVVSTSNKGAPGVVVSGPCR